MKKRVLSALLCLLLVAATTLPALTPILKPIEAEAAPVSTVQNGYGGYNCLIFPAAYINKGGALGLSHGDSNQANSFWAYNSSATYNAGGYFAVTGKSGGGAVRISIDYLLANYTSTGVPGDLETSWFNRVGIIYRNGNVSSLTAEIHVQNNGTTQYPKLSGLSTNGYLNYAGAAYSTSGHIDSVRLVLTGTIYIYAIVFYKDSFPTSYYTNEVYNKSGAINASFIRSNGVGSLSEYSRSYGWVYEGVTITMPTATPPTGYHLDGWYLNNAGNSLGSSYYCSISPNTVKTASFTARWAPNIYYVAYNGNGNTGGSTSTSTHYYDTTGYLTANGFTKDGYHFTGWNTAQNGSGTPYGNQAEVNNWATGNGVTAKTLYAQWAPNTYTVEYNANGGSGTMSNSTHTYDTAQQLTANGFTKTGYDFVGWATSANGDALYADGASVTNLTATNGGTVTLYAKWGVHPYTITYDVNGGNALQSDTVTYTVESPTTLATPTRDGYIFAGWKSNTDAGGWSTSTSYQAGDTTTSSMVGDVTLTAQWTPAPYTVTLVEDNDTSSVIDYNIKDIINLPIPTKVGYTFDGWEVTTAEGNWNLNDLYTTGNLLIAAGKYGNVTLTAQWTVNTYAITYDAADGDMPDEYPSTYTYNAEEEQSLPTPTRENYEFLGWKVMGLADGATGWTLDETVKAVPSGATGAVTLTAQWKLTGIPVSYVISSPAQGVGTLTCTEDIVDGTTFIANTGSKIATLQPGYAFKGWYTNSACTDPVAPAWVDENGELKVDLSEVDPSDRLESYTFYAKVDYDIRPVSITADCTTDDSTQTFIYCIEGTPVLTDVFGSEISLLVTVTSGETLQVMLPLGDYSVTEYVDWSWRYRDSETEASEKKKADIDFTSDLSFTYGTPTNPLWLNGYSAAATPSGKEPDITA